jgi:hypothetical protein
MYTFQAGKGINVTKLNSNFNEVVQKANTNEEKLVDIANKSLLKDGSNLTQTIVEDFNRHEPIYLSGSGTQTLTDNRTHYLTLTGNATISLPTPANDMMSHTIVLLVQGSNYTLYLGTEKYLNSPGELKTTKPYQVLYVYNKLDKSWYYCLGQ